MFVSNFDVRQACNIAIFVPDIILFTNKLWQIQIAKHLTA
jgi:hypothetical protein